MAAKIDLNVSLDGFATTTDQTPENPMGQDWFRLTEAYVATRTMRKGARRHLGRRHDVRIGGGIDVVRQFLRVDLVDRMHLAVAPLVLGSGERIWTTYAESSSATRSPARWPRAA